MRQCLEKNIKCMKYKWRRCGISQDSHHSHWIWMHDVKAGNTSFCYTLHTSDTTNALRFFVWVHIKRSPHEEKVLPSSSALPGAVPYLQAANEFLTIQQRGASRNQETRYTKDAIIYYGFFGVIPYILDQEFVLDLDKFQSYTLVIILRLAEIPWLTNLTGKDSIVYTDNNGILNIVSLPNRLTCVYEKCPLQEGPAPLHQTTRREF